MAQEPEKAGTRRVGRGALGAAAVAVVLIAIGVARRRR